MEQIEILYYAETPGVRRSDLATSRAVGSARSNAKFHLYFCLADFAVLLAQYVPRLQGTEQDVEVLWQTIDSFALPVLRLKGTRFEVPYPLDALRGGEVIPPNLRRSHAGQTLYFVARRAEGGAGVDGLQPVAEDRSEIETLSVVVPTIPTRTAASPPPDGVLGAAYRLRGDPVVTLPWAELQHWAREAGKALRDGQAFAEQGFLGGGKVYLSPEGELVNEVVALLPVKDPDANAASFAFAPEDYRAHERDLERLSRLHYRGELLQLTAWAHSHHFARIEEELGAADDAPAQEGQKESGANGGPISSLAFSSFDIRVHQRSYQAPWAVALVMDAGAAELILEPGIADADRLFAVYGWRRGMLVRRAAFLAVGPRPD